MNYFKILKLFLVISLTYFQVVGQEIEFVQMVTDPVIQPDALVVGDIIFPRSLELYQEGDDAPLLVFKDQLEIEIPINWKFDKPTGSYQVNGQLYYQTCDYKKCYFPRNFDFSFVLEVVEG